MRDNRTVNRGPPTGEIHLCGLDRDRRLVPEIPSGTAVFLRDGWTQQTE